MEEYRRNSSVRQFFVPETVSKAFRSRTLARLPMKDDSYRAEPHSRECQYMQRLLLF